MGKYTFEQWKLRKMFNRIQFRAQNGGVSIQGMPIL